jgi:hypothetical protein
MEPPPVPHVPGSNQFHAAPFFIGACLPQTAIGDAMTLIIIVLLILLLGGGGFGYSRYGMGGLGGVLGLVLVIILILYLLGALGVH